MKLITIYVIVAILLVLSFMLGRCEAENMELMHIIRDSDFAVGLPNCKIREEHLFEKGTLTEEEIKLLKKCYPKDNWHFKFDEDISKCRACGLIWVICSGYDYYKVVPKGTSKDGVMFMWFFDFEDNYLLKRIWELETRIEKLGKEKREEIYEIVYDVLHREAIIEQLGDLDERLKKEEKKWEKPKKKK